MYKHNTSTNQNLTRAARELGSIGVCKLTAAAALTTMLVTGCTFTGVAGITPEVIKARWSNASMTQPYSSYLTTTQSGLGYEIQHGASCASAATAHSTNNAGRSVFGIGIEETIEIPQHLDDATVFMNGWRLRYREDDHQVLAMSSAIVDIEVRDGNLNWFAGGILSDKNGDDAFDWCYSYTAIFWKNNRHTNISVSDTDTDARHIILSRDDVPNDSEQSERGSLTNLPFEPKALLPRGFGMMFGTREDDHKLLQFDLKHGDIHLSNNPDTDTRLFFWDFETVFRGKDNYRRYDAAQVTSALGGGSVQLTQTDFEVFSIPEIGQHSGLEGVVTQDVVVEEVPFDAAVPVLMGWSIADLEKEIQPQDMGVWIESFHYDRAPGARFGTLIYRINSVFVDDNGRFSSGGSITPRLQVNILGINSLARTSRDVTTNVVTETGQDNEELTTTSTGTATSTGSTVRPVRETAETPSPNIAAAKGK